MALTRQQEMEQVAYDLGLEYHLEDEPGTLPYLGGFRFLKHAHSRRISHLLHFKDDMLNTDLRIFDIKYSRGYGKHKRTYRQTVFFLQSKQLGLPEFFMEPETLFRKLKIYLKLNKDINFPEYPKFSSQYYLTGEDEDYIRATFQDPVLKLFSAERDWTLEGVNYYMVLYRRNQLLPPNAASFLYRFGIKLSNLLAAGDLEL